MRIRFTALWIFTSAAFAALDPNDPAAAQLQRQIRQLQQTEQKEARQQPVEPLSSSNAAATTTNSAPFSRQAATSQEIDEQRLATRALNASAFHEAVQNALPLTPEQIVRLRQLFNQSRAAMVASPTVPPKPVVSSRYVNLAPGSTPMVVRLAQGYVSTLACLDSTGQPWPISGYNIGNPSAFNIQWDKKSNLLMIQATELYTTGNLAVQLQGMATPIMLTLVSGQKAVDYRLDLRVSGIGPNAKPMLGRQLPVGADSTLLGVLDGVPPAGNKPLQIVGGPAQAWLVGNKLYVRTRLSLLSPAWVGTLSSPDGMRAYELPKVPLILASANGRSLQLKVEGW